MTEPNEPTTPLARMRFSWQRGGDVSDAPEATDDDASVDEASPGEASPGEDAADQAAVELESAEPESAERAAAEDADGRRASGTPKPAPVSRPERAPAPEPGQSAQSAQPVQERQSGQEPRPGREARPTSDLPVTAGSSPARSSAAPRAVPDEPTTPTNGHAVAGDSGPAVSRRVREEARNRRDESRSEPPEPDVDDPAWAATDLGELDDPPARPESRRRRKHRERQERKSRAAQAKAAQKNARKAARTRAAPAPAPTASRRSRRNRGDFDVPAPGRRFSGGRAAHTGLRVALVVTACLMALGVVAYAAFALGISTGRDNNPRLSGADLARYRLTAFPTAEAGQFAADYARLCFTHDPTPGANDARERQLARYVSSGTDPRCGWNGEGSQSVVDSTWTGDSEPIDVPGLQGNARMMTVRVLTDSGSSRIVTVPVYVADLANANGMRIVGDIGEMPQPNLAAAPEVKPPSATDSRLSEALTQGQFFEQFFTAWGASDGPALQRLVTPDATARTRAGLNRVLVSPTIQEARVFLPKGADPSTPYEWKTGQTAQAWVWVVWQTPGEGSKATETRAYRLQLEKTTQASSPTQEWAVRDIQGGIPDVKGG